MYGWKQFAKDYWVFIERYGLRFMFYTLLKSLSDSANFAIAFSLGKVIDSFAYSGSFYPWIGAIALIGAFQIWLRFHAKVKLQTIGAEIRKKVRINALSSLISQQLKHDEDTGSKIEKINNGGESLFQGIRVFSNEGIIIATGIIASIVIFMALDWKYLVFAVAYFSLYIVSELFFTKRLNHYQDLLNQAKEVASGKMHESASNILTIKAMRLEKNIGKRTENCEDQYFKAWLKTRNLSQIKLQSLKIFSAMAYAAFILVVALDADRGLITVGSIYVFASYFGKLREALHELTNKMGDFIAVKSSVGRLMTIYSPITLEKKAVGRWDTIKFEEVTFSYRNKPVLRNFNLTIRKKEKIGIAGLTGSGKSTIIKLLLGLYKPQKGKILMDGKLQKPDAAVVLQEPELFNLSLRENICFEDEPMEEAIKNSRLGPLIKKLSEGLDTLIGERGYKLSGGERQRVGIARALCLNSDFLILDEATSSLDLNTESIILKNILKLDKTLLMIAHRLASLKKLDKIHFLENGRIAESGTFDELMGKKGLFYSLYVSQN